MSKYNDPNPNEEHEGGWMPQNKTVQHRSESEAGADRSVQAQHMKAGCSNRNQRGLIHHQYILEKIHYGENLKLLSAPYGPENAVSRKSVEKQTVVILLFFALFMIFVIIKVLQIPLASINIKK